MNVPRRCSRPGCAHYAVATLTYVYADSTAVVGPLAIVREPHTWDLCLGHASRITAPRGWELVRHAGPLPTNPDEDDLVVSVMSSDEPVNLQIGYRLPIYESLSGVAFTTGEPQRSYNIHADTRIYNAVKTLVDVKMMLAVPLKSGITFENVGFRYPGTESWALRGLSGSIRPQRTQTEKSASRARPAPITKTGA